jgi:PAS domain S-box-containing protein
LTDLPPTGEFSNARDRIAELQDLIDSLKETIYEADARGVFTYVSRAGLALYGYCVADVSSGRLNVLDTIVPEEREQARATMAAALQLGESTPMDHTGLKKNGTRFPVRIYPSPVPARAGEPPRLRGFVVDMTETRAQEEALRTSEARLRTVFETVNDGILVIGLEGRILDANPATFEMFGIRDLDAMRAIRAGNLVIPEERERLQRDFRRIVDRRRLPATAYTGLRSDDSTFPASLSGALLVDAGGRPASVVGVVRDETQARQAEEERSRWSRLESVGHLAGGIAHDFNNLLAALLGNVSLARVYVDQPERCQERLEMAERVLARAADLTQELLTFARGGAPVVRPVPLGDLIPEVASFATRGSKTLVESRIPPDLWSVAGDPGQTARVLQNLVINADQAMPDGGTVTIEATNVVVDEHSNDWPPGRYVQVEIRDTGVGIPTENIPRIFDPYFTTRPGGTGLGLAVVHSIVARHGGRIQLRSEPGKGTAFTILLPATPEHVSPDGPAPADPDPPPSRLLVLEDDPDVREGLASLLVSLGHTQESAADADTAMELFRAAQVAGHPFDAVILDLTIRGGAGGLEVLERLRAVDPEVRAVVSSGYSTDAVMARYREYGFQGLLPKPYRREELSRILARVLGSRPPA